MNVCVASRVKTLLQKFWGKEDATSTVEFVLMVPIMAAMFGLVIDTALVFGGRSQILRVTQDVNRAVSIGLVRDLADAEQMIIDNIQSFAPAAVAETTVASGIISTVVTLPMSDLTSTGFVTAFKDFTIIVSAQHLAEN